jgi:hypothetical protein
MVGEGKAKEKGRIEKMEKKINEIWSRIQAAADRALNYGEHPRLLQLCDMVGLTETEKAFAEAYKAFEDETI